MTWEPIYLAILAVGAIGAFGLMMLPLPGFAG
jgi:hypothetical protein